MEKLFISVFAGAMMCGLVLAQTDSAPSSNSAQQNQPNATRPASSSAAASETLKIAPGSVIPVQLTKTIDAKKMKSGDEVQARVTQDMKTGNGDVLVPKDTKVLGHVTEAQARTKEQKESAVAITFDHAVMKNGSEVPLPMSIQAIVGQENPNPNNGSASADSGQYPSSSPSSPSAGSSPNSGSRPGSMGTGAAPTQAPSGSSEQPTANAGTNTPAITANTQGVVGISNLKLSTAEGTQGSLITSEKSNVKLDSGTLMLLRVNQDTGKPQ